ncbi:MAG: DNRLRE domain-containing protein [Phycisphaeraceae bacterium]|nr:DNRLRE domain-containing protein [Phycisphaerales bacterium]MCB9859419.1 DNRLRE domain-containing protein [Phycisphaeraceae bacterium]
MHFRTIAGLVLIASAGALADTVTLVSSKDNTMYISGTTLASNAVGDSMFCGTTASGIGFIRRCLIEFDIAGNIPAGSTVTNVSLQLQMTKSISGSHDHTLHKVMASWGEGTSNGGNSGGGAVPTPGDATWLHRFFDTDLWTTPGGDFVAAASATTSVGGVGAYSWSDAGLTADVQDWVDNPSNNFGWVLIGDEAGSPTAKRWATREHATVAWRPTLVVDFDPPAVCYPDCDNSGALNIFDYICFGNAYAVQDPYADCDNSGTFNIFDYICFGNAYAAGCP